AAAPAVGGRGRRLATPLVCGTQTRIGRFRHLPGIGFSSAYPQTGGLLARAGCRRLLPVPDARRRHNASVSLDAVGGFRQPAELAPLAWPSRGRAGSPAPAGLWQLAASRLLFAHDRRTGAMVLAPDRARW